MKIITIDHCGECPHNHYRLLQVSNFCKLMELKQIIDAKRIPLWCPLEDKR